MLCLLAAILIVRLLTTTFEPLHSVLGDLALKATIVVGFLTWARRYMGMSWQELGLRRADARAGLRAGLPIAASFAILYAVIAAIPATRSYLPIDGVASDSVAKRLLDPLVYIPLGTVVFEESIFRAVLLGVLERAWGQGRAALLWSSVAFGGWHIPPIIAAHKGGVRTTIGNAGGTFLITAIGGLLFGYVRQRSKSTVAPAIGHIATNSFGYLAAIIAWQL